MEREKILEKLQAIFRSVLKNDTLVLDESLTAKDVEGWNSLTHIMLIAETEKCFSIKFKLKELTAMKNIGSLVTLISEKTK